MDISLVGKLLLFWYSFIFVSSELLSFFHLLKRPFILFGELIFWVVILIFFGNQIIKEVRSINFKNLYALIIFVLLSLTFIQGIFSAPNTTDSMVYHIPRVMYWVQEKTLQQDVIRNPHDFMPPFGEYILLHLYLIAGNDRLLFFSQWIAFAVTIILGGVIAGQLGAETRFKNLTRLIVATLPIATIQSSSTQVDLITAVLILISTHIALLFLKKVTIYNVILFGLTLGLGISTKPTFFIFALIPLGVTFFALIKNRFKNVLKVFLGGFISLILPLRFMTQNLHFYGNILGPLKNDANGGLTNDLINLQSLISNIIRNMLIHIPVPFFTNQTQSLLEFIHKIVGISINDPRITCCDFQFRVIPVLYPQEDIAGNALHLILILIAAIFIFKKILRRRQLILVYILSLLSFIMFSIVLKWQPFHSRLHIPFFVIGAISSVLILSRFKYSLYILRSILILSVPLAFLLIFFNVSKPFISYTPFYSYVKVFAPALSSIPQSVFTKNREEQYFNARSYWYNPYKYIIKVLTESKAGKQTVAFKLMDGYEYPLWLLIQENNLKYHIVPESKISDETIIISTSKNPYNLTGYKTECIKTEIEYGYACISIKL